MDRLNDDLLRIILSKALDSEPTAIQRQHQRLCVYAVIKPLRHAAERLDQHLTVFRPQRMACCPALNYESLTTDLHLVWSHKAPGIAHDLDAPAYKLREGYDCDLCSDIARLTLHIDNLLEPPLPGEGQSLDGNGRLVDHSWAGHPSIVAEKEGRPKINEAIVDYLASKAVLLPRIKYLCLAGRRRITSSLLQQLLRYCEQLDTLALCHAETTYISERVIAADGQLMAGRVVHRALPFQLRHVELGAGSSHLLKWLLTRTELNTEGEQIPALFVGMTDRFTLCISHLDYALRQHAECVTSLRITGHSLSKEEAYKRGQAFPLPSHCPSFLSFDNCVSLRVDHWVSDNLVVHLRHFVALRELFVGDIAPNLAPFVFVAALSRPTLESMDMPKSLPVANEQIRSWTYLGLVALEQKCRERGVKLTLH